MPRPAWLSRSREKHPSSWGGCWPRATIPSSRGDRDQLLRARTGHRHQRRVSRPGLIEGHPPSRSSAVGPESAPPASCPSQRPLADRARGGPRDTPRAVLRRSGSRPGGVDPPRRGSLSRVGGNDVPRAALSGRGPRASSDRHPSTTDQSRACRGQAQRGLALRRDASAGPGPGRQVQPLCHARHLQPLQPRTHRAQGRGRRGRSQLDDRARPSRQQT